MLFWAFAKMILLISQIFQAKKKRDFLIISFYVP